MKSVIIIAVVAVAMIGVMVPSSFAQTISQDNTVKLFLINENGKLAKNIDTRQPHLVDGEFSISNLEIIENEFYNVVKFQADYRILDESYFDNLRWDRSVRTYDGYDSKDPTKLIKGISGDKLYSHDKVECKPIKFDKQSITKKTGNFGYVKMCFSVEKEIDELSITTAKVPWYRDMPYDENRGVSVLIDTISIQNIIMEQNSKKETSEGGGCLIATATYGSELAPQVQQLRELRDNQLLQTESGTAFMGTFNNIYYSFSPTIADYERENPLFKETVKLAITPMISTLSLMENAETESEVLGIGISVIMLNLGMYFGVPAIVVIGIRRNF